MQEGMVITEFTYSLDTRLWLLTLDTQNEGLFVAEWVGLTNGEKLNTGTEMIRRMEMAKACAHTSSADN